MKTEHPITPPPELVEKWANHSASIHRENGTYAQHEFQAVATQAARWGADQELEACCEWADETGWTGAGSVLRRLRRPKPPSLKDEALKALRNINRGTDRPKDTDTIRRALEALPMSETKVVELPKPDYALIYAKLARHVAAADALLNHCNDSEASKEMEEAMQAIATFERTFATPAFVIAVEAPPNV